MKLTKARLLMVFTLLVASLSPTPAYAHAGWWDWLDSLSGPGPFNRYDLPTFPPFNLYDLRLACAFADDQKFKGEPAPKGWMPIWHKVSAPGPLPIGYPQFPCFSYSDEANRYVELRVGWISTPEQQLFSDRPNELIGTVTAHQVQAFYMTQVHPSLSIGPGAGILWFSGTPASGQPQNVIGHPYTLVLTPLSGSFKPLRLVSNRWWTNVLLVRAEGIIVPPFDKDDFNKNSTSTFDSSPELLGSIGITFDVTPFFHR